MSNTKRWIHPNARKQLENSVTEKSLARDQTSYNSARQHRFMHGLQNSRFNLLNKIDNLSLQEALDSTYTPRYRHNHSHTYPCDLGKEWNSMVRHDDSIAWKWTE